MGKKTNLRDFQAYLAERLSAAARSRAAASWLAFEIGEEGWLVDLPDGGEIVQAPQLAPVPLTCPWFAGIANIRGNLYSVSDFALLRGAAPTPRNAAARLLLVGVRHGSNAALLVSRLLGLKNPADFRADGSDAEFPAWGAGRQVDAEGRVWHKLDVQTLLQDQDFMNIGV